MIRDITTQCWILALFVRDDGERLLLGTGNYEFKEKQMHFYANKYVNDTVDIQGNDGLMLAGQVRRAATQPFDGYIGGPSYTKQEVEQYRQDFLKFFRKNHYYEVIYIFTDGSAIKRNKGFIVDAPEVKEIRQLSPEYHVSLNFEDVNYYEYQEDADGNEIYSDSANIPLSTTAKGGLVWEDDGILWDSGTKNLLNQTLVLNGQTKNVNGVDITGNADGSITAVGTASANIVIFLFGAWAQTSEYIDVTEASIFTLDTDQNIKSAVIKDGTTYIASPGTTINIPANTHVTAVTFEISSGTAVNGNIYPMIRKATDSPDFEPYIGAAVWEAGGGGGLSNVQVDSIDMVYPVLTIQGPAQNPVIENLTTNTRIEFSGNVTNSQTLVIDSRNQTAKLNGTSVITSIIGDWTVFAPGINQVSYTAENDTAPDALIEWSEVVG